MRVRKPVMAVLLGLVIGNLTGCGVYMDRYRLTKTVYAEPRERFAFAKKPEYDRRDYDDHRRAIKDTLPPVRIISVKGKVDGTDVMVSPRVIAGIVEEISSPGVFPKVDWVVQQPLDDAINLTIAINENLEYPSGWGYLFWMEASMFTLGVGVPLGWTSYTGDIVWNVKAVYNGQESRYTLHSADRTRVHYYNKGHQTELHRGGDVKCGTIAGMVREYNNKDIISALTTRLLLDFSQRSQSFARTGDGYPPPETYKDSELRDGTPWVTQTWAGALGSCLQAAGTQ